MNTLRTFKFFFLLSFSLYYLVHILYLSGSSLVPIYSLWLQVFYLLPCYSIKICIFRFRGLDLACPGGCSYSRDGDTYCFGPGARTGALECPASTYGPGEMSENWVD